MAQLTIKALRNGPYEVAGVAEVKDYENASYPTEPSPVYLCRCGHSANKPFCDGSHKRVGFQAEESVRVRPGR